MSKPFPWENDQEGYDKWIEDLLKKCPESWDGDEAAEYIISEYLHQLELRIDALGGSLERYPDESKDELKPKKPAHDSKTFRLSCGCDIDGHG